MFNEDEESDGTGDGSEEYLRRADFQNYTALKRWMMIMNRIVETQM